MTETLWAIVSVVVLVFFFGLILHSVYDYAKKVPISTKNGEAVEPAGVQKGLLVVVGFTLAIGFYRLAEAANFFSFVMSRHADDPALTVLVANVGPSALAALAAFIAVHRLAGGRTLKALIAALAGLVYSGVAHPFVLNAILNVPLDTVELSWTIAGSVLSVVYLVFSRRAKNTYWA